MIFKFSILSSRFQAFHGNRQIADKRVNDGCLFQALWQARHAIVQGHQVVVTL